MGGNRVKDLTGLTFGRLRVLDHAGQDKHGKALWNCECQCSETKIVLAQSLVSGRTVSCGCHNRERAAELARENAKNRRTHGQSGTPMFEVWRGAVRRCTDPNGSKYPDYGGRGITVCARWMESNGRGLLNFISDMGQRPEGMTLDRIDADGPYSPENCRWATQEQQQNNRRNNRRITYRDVTLTVAQWAKALGIKDAALRGRIVRLGWPVERALTEGVDPSRLTTAIAKHGDIAAGAQPHQPRLRRPATSIERK